MMGPGAGCQAVGERRGRRRRASQRARDLRAEGDARRSVENARATCSVGTLWRRERETTLSGGVALASAGSTIIVCAGTYHESVTISKNNLTIRAKGAPGNVVLNGNAQALFAGFYILNASGNSIEGFRIEQFHEAGILLD